jgi:hypothetical protein
VLALAVTIVTKSLLDTGLGWPSFPPAQVCLTRNSAAVVLHVNLEKHPPLMSRSSLDGPCVLTVLRSPPSRPRLLLTPIMIPSSSSPLTERKTGPFPASTRSAEIHIGSWTSSVRSIRSRCPAPCRNLGHVVWNDSVRIGDDAIGLANIFYIRVSSSAQGAAAVSAPGLVFS